MRSSGGVITFARTLFSIPQLAGAAILGGAAGAGLAGVVGGSWGAGIGFLLLLARVLLVRATIDNDVLHIRNRFRSHTIKKADVDSFTTRQFVGIGESPPVIAVALRNHKIVKIEATVALRRRTRENIAEYWITHGARPSDVREFLEY